MKTEDPRPRLIPVTSSQRIACQATSFLRSVRGITLILLATAQFISGCSTSMEKQTSEAIKSGFSAINTIHLRKHDSSPVIVSHGRVKGDHHADLTVNELEALSTFNGKWGTLELAIPQNGEPDFIRDAICLDDNASPDFGAAFEDAVGNTLASMPELVNRKIKIHVAVVRTNSGYAIEHSSPADHNPLSVAVIAYTDDAAECRPNHAVRFWERLARTIPHELLHLQYQLSELDVSVSGVDNEAAAYLMGHCSTARFAQALSAKRVDAVFDIDPEFFPGVSDGIFSPNLPEPLSLADQSAQGRAVATALIYHLYADANGNLNYANAESTRPMFQLCDSLATNVASLSKGELPKGTEVAQP